ncbi:hypothetical protein FOA52_015928 [Chlamydomonas sp. UWO 241]|nr:hypothetical protein FOA52_015928 [Chlamydomonas sp. UWO 241]
MVLLSHGGAALGLWDRRGRIVHHRVHTAYTVRANRGRAQATHDAAGGRRATAGSVLRQRETVRLWRSVAKTLSEWSSDIRACDRLMASGDARVWSLLWSHSGGSRGGSSGAQLPFGPGDARWERVGVGVPRPRLRDLDRCHAALCYGRVGSQPTRNHDRDPENPLAVAVAVAEATIE